LRILEEILTNKNQRKELIDDFQKKIWEQQNYYTSNEVINSILSELAYDLDFYEPNEEWRKEDPSYYGEERLEQEIKDALRKIERYKRLKES